MKVNRKKNISKINKIKQKKVIISDQQEGMPMPMVLGISNQVWLLLCEPHKYYKVKGVRKILYAGANYIADGIENSQVIDSTMSILEVSETQDNISVQVLQKLEKFNVGKEMVHQIQQYLNQAIPILVEAVQLHIQQTQHPKWSQKVMDIINKAFKDNNRRKILIAGNKNTGKSTLSTFMEETLVQETFRSKSKNVCLLDLDIGKGRGLPATINLYRHTGKEIETLTYWIGEYTPLNYYNLYLQSVIVIMQKYNICYFDDVLIVNTMGYLTGFGQLIMIELYKIIQPAQVLYLAKEQQRHSYSTFKQLFNNTSERSKLLGKEYSEFSSSFELIINHHTTTKSKIVSKSKSFEEYLGLKSIEDMAIHRVPQVSFKQIAIQSKNGQMLFKDYNPLYTDLQLLIICDLEGQVYRFRGLGFGFGGKLFSNFTGTICIKSEVIEFQKQFYNLNQKQIISLQQTIQSKLDFILPVYRGLGNMGYRNLSSKRVMRS